MIRALVAVVTATGIVSAGCGARQWPERVVAVSTADFAKHTNGVASIDVLPLDLELWTEPGYDANPADLRSGAETRIMNVALDALVKRNYEVGALIDWNGDYSGGAALPKPALLATIGALARYSDAVTQHPRELPIPYLPARLGVTTGADATLYVGGWAYVANHHESTGEQVAKGIAIALVVVAVVVIVAMIARGSDHGSHSHHGGGGSFADHSSVSASRGFHHVNRGAELAVDLIDAFGREAMVVATHPEWSAEPSAPHQGDSQMFLEMTLVDNRTGLALWHAHQIFPANAADVGDTERVAHTLVAMLPPR